MMKTLWIAAVVFSSASFAHPASANEYDDRAAAASKRESDAEYARWNAMMVSGFARRNSAFLRQLRTFADRHGGLTVEATCLVSPEGCHRIDKNESECLSNRTQGQTQPISAIQPAAMVSVGPCDLSTRDGLACRADHWQISCYDSADRLHSFAMKRVR